jgi:predicted porin
LYNGSREIFVGGLYKLGSFKFQGAYTHMSAPDAPADAPNRADHEWLGVTYQVNPVATVTVGGYHINANRGGGNATIYEAGGTYSLSKRTLLYLTGATVRNSASADFSLEAADQNKSGALPDPENPLPGHSQAGFFAGINHSF